jgi:hypothetical protein
MPAQASIKNSGTKLPNAEHFLHSVLGWTYCHDEQQLNRSGKFGSSVQSIWEPFIKRIRV